MLTKKINNSTPTTTSKNINQEIVSYVDELKRQRTINKVYRKKL